jgi:hypothetical protein
MSANLKVETEMSSAEWQARCDLAALYRICDHFGWTDILATHMSVDRQPLKIRPRTAPPHRTADLHGGAKGEATARARAGPGPEEEATYMLSQGTNF